MKKKTHLNTNCKPTKPRTSFPETVEEGVNATNQKKKKHPPRQVRKGRRDKPNQKIKRQKEKSTHNQKIQKN